MLTVTKLDHDTELLVERGREAWQSLRRDETWEKWVAIGRAIEAGRNFIMREVLHTNQPKGRAWSETFGWWLKQNGFDEIDKSVRSRLQSCLDNLPAIEAWRQEIGLTLRLQLNHPNAVLRRWQAKHQIETGGDAKPATGGLKSEVMRLQTDLDTAQRELARLKRSRETVSEGADWTWQDDPDVIAEVWMRLQPNKAPRIASKVLELAKATTKKPRAGKVNREPAGERHW